MDAASRLREYAGDGTVLGDDVAEVLAELDAARARLAELEAVADAAQELIRQFDDPPFLIGDNGGGVDEFGGTIDKLRTALAPKD